MSSRSAMMLSEGTRIASPLKASSSEDDASVAPTARMMGAASIASPRTPASKARIINSCIAEQDQPFGGNFRAALRADQGSAQRDRHRRFVGLAGRRRDALGEPQCRA